MADFLRLRHFFSGGSVLARETPKEPELRVAEDETADVIRLQAVDGLAENVRPELLADEFDDLHLGLVENRAVFGHDVYNFAAKFDAYILDLLVKLLLEVRTEKFCALNLDIFRDDLF